MADNNNEQKQKRRRANKVAKPLNIIIGIIVFLIIGGYIVYSLFAYLRSNPVAGYEVKVGSLTSPATFTGLVLRDEEIVYANDAGYVNYYTREGERVANGDLVYSVDSSGELAEMLKNAGEDDRIMSNDDFEEIKNEIVSFTKDFSTDRFTPVYDFKYNLQGTTLKLSNLNVLNSIDSMNSARVGNSIRMKNAPRSGYVVFSVDNYEEVSLENITVDHFERKDYEKKQFVNNELVASGNPVYKLVVSEDWDVVIQTDESTAQKIKEQGSVTVKFLKNQTTCTASTDVIKHGEGTFVVLSFRNYVSSFVNDRYMDIEIVMEEKTGLKIPNTSIVEKEFFLIPEEYGTILDDDGNVHLNIQTYNDKGQLAIVDVKTEIYDRKFGYYYINAPEIELGTVITMPDSTQTFTASKKGTLIGVYNINKGYADFRQITVQYQNEEYSIVTPNSTYGLRAYDYIVLNADAVNDDDIIYQ